MVYTSIQAETEILPSSKNNFNSDWKGALGVKQPHMPQRVRSCNDMLGKPI